MSQFGEDWAGRAHISVGRQNSLLLVGGGLAVGCEPFVLLRVSTDRMRPTHIREGSLFTQIQYPNVNLIEKYRHRDTQNFRSGNVWPSQVDK